MTKDYRYLHYRYSLRNPRIKELIGSDAIGDVVSVHFEWMLDTRYDADDGLLLEDGVNSIMAVIAANRSFATGKPVHIRVLLRA